MIYVFTFADGHKEWTRGYDKTEKKMMELKHGKIIKKERA